jgi:hypothetical protein
MVEIYWKSKIKLRCKFSVRPKIDHQVLFA